MEQTIPAIDVRKYGGKQVAILDGEIIAVGNTLKEVLEHARVKVFSRPLTEIKIFAVPKSLSVIYYVSGISIRDHAPRRGQGCVVSCC